VTFKKYFLNALYYKLECTFLMHFKVRRKALLKMYILNWFFKRAWWSDGRAPRSPMRRPKK
jgi:hypothetical protein